MADGPLFSKHESVVSSEIDNAQYSERNGRRRAHPPHNYIGDGDAFPDASMPKGSGAGLWSLRSSKAPSVTNKGPQSAYKCDVHALFVHEVSTSANQTSLVQGNEASVENGGAT